MSVRTASFRPSAALALALFFVASVAVHAEAPVVRPRVVAVHPHDPAAFTQGLVVEDGVLYESTGLYGRSSIRRVDLGTGRVLAIRTLGEDLFAEGLAAIRGRLYQLTWRAGAAFVRDPRTLDQVARFRYEGEGWGLARHGRRLVMSDGTEVLRIVDPESFRVVDTLAVHDAGNAIAWLNELEVVDDVLYANVWRTTRIARIDLSTGAVIDWVELDALVPEADRGAMVGVANGIAYDPGSGHLLITGKLWPVLYEVVLPQPRR